MGLYPKPSGYATSRLVAGSQSYKPFNNYLSGSMRYAPNRPQRQSLSLTFNAAPANGSQLVIQDGPPNSPGSSTKTFTFTYSGSPGAGIIPLVAGGGTAAQAATATQVALAAQLSTWDVTNPAAGQVIMTQRQRGVTDTVTTVGTTNITFVVLANAVFRRVLPALVGGKLRGLLTDSTNIQT